MHAATTSRTQVRSPCVRSPLAFIAYISGAHEVSCTQYEVHGKSIACESPRNMPPFNFARMRTPAQTFLA
jgi:hypothetical protein